MFEKNLRFYSSFIFITNVIFCYFTHFYLHSFLFGLLTISSLFVHGYFLPILDNYNINYIIVNAIDKLIILQKPTVSVRLPFFYRNYINYINYRNRRFL
jgi:hypothetical protein